MAARDWLPEAVSAVSVERALCAGESLFRRGSRTAGLHEIVSGNVRLVRVDAAGREVILYVARAGDLIAEASLFSPTYQCDAIATTNVVVRLYPKAVIVREFERDPKAARSFMAMLGRHIMDLRTRLEFRNIRSARDRIRHYLAVNAGADGRTVTLRQTLKDVAAEIGLTHEALYRTLAELSVDGEIERLDGEIRLTGKAAI
jgi:CRP-like cAMP-binding protein